MGAQAGAGTCTSITQGLRDLTMPGVLVSIVTYLSPALPGYSIGPAVAYKGNLRQDKALGQIEDPPTHTHTHSPCPEVCTEGLAGQSSEWMGRWVLLLLGYLSAPNPIIPVPPQKTQELLHDNSGSYKLLLPNA